MFRVGRVVVSRAWTPVSFTRCASRAYSTFSFREIVETGNLEIQVQEPDTQDLVGPASRLYKQLKNHENSLEMFEYV